MNFECFKIKNRSGKLIDVISKTANISKKQAKKVIEEGLVSINGIKNLRYRTSVKNRDIVEFTLNPILFLKKEPETVYEDKYLLIINKPPFINTLKDSPDIETVLRRKHPFIKAVHRLDKQTTGAVIFAKSEKTFKNMVDIFKKNRIKKEYQAVVFPCIKREIRITSPIENRKAITSVKPIKNYKEASLTKITIETGRKHQIRKHLFSIGHNVVGEFLYFNKIYPSLLRFSPRILLHAHSIEFLHPESGKPVIAKASAGKDFLWFEKVLERGRETLPLKEYT